ncbi:MAG: hypothetical protein JSS98_07660 [Bacteroidetes bacterium]|nr:hypothetical protein [Bacteroidota bacterium]
MKKVTLLFVFAMYCIALQAKTWRINNNTGITADFTSIQAAINSASVLNGDTLHVESSAAAYDGNVTLNKRLVIIGTGYYLSETSPLVANPNTQANTKSCFINNGIACSPGSKGSVISGLTMYDVSIIDSFVTVQRCKFTNLYFGGYYSNADSYADTIRQNVITGGIGVGGGSTGKQKNQIIYNNIIYGGIDFTANITKVDGFFINNSFVYSPYATYYTVYISCQNFVFQNNIFGDVNFGVYQSFNAYFNNICHNTGIPAGNGNQQNIDANATVYNNWFGNGAGFSSDGRFQLKSGSTPASGTGSLNGGAVDCGAFGGPAPYILSGMPSVPSIYSLSVPASVNSGTTSMTVTFSSASH